MRSQFCGARDICAKEKARVARSVGSVCIQASSRGCEGVDLVHAVLGREQSTLQRQVSTASVPADGLQLSKKVCIAPLDQVRTGRHSSSEVGTEDRPRKAAIGPAGPLQLCIVCRS